MSEKPPIDDQTRRMIENASPITAPNTRSLGPVRKPNKAMQRVLLYLAIGIVCVMILQSTGFFGALTHTVTGKVATNAAPTSAPPQSAALSATDIIAQASRGTGTQGQAGVGGASTTTSGTTGTVASGAANPEVAAHLTQQASNFSALGPPQTPTLLTAKQVRDAFGPPPGPSQSTTVATPAPEVPAPTNRIGPDGLLIASVVPQDDVADVGTSAIPVPSSSPGDTNSVQTPAQLRTTARLAFLAGSSGALYERGQEQPPMQSIEIFAGTATHWRLTSTIDTSQPGYVWAELTEPVRSSLPVSITCPDGTTRSTYPIIWPDHTVARGRVDGNVAQGDSHLTTSWDGLILPNGWTYNLGGMQGADDNGANGISGTVNNHVGRTYTTVFLGSLLTGLAAASGPGGGSYPSAGQSVAAGAAGSLANSVNGQLQQNLSIPPSIVVEAGKTFVIRLEATIVNVRPYQACPAT